MSNEQRTPISRVLPLAAQRAALLEIEKRGYALPCHVTAVDGQIVTVAFDVAGALLPTCTMAIAGAEYIRFPTQVGDKGVAEPASVDIGIATGLGPANALPDIRTRPGNLSALVFKPVGNASWTASPNQNALVGYGPASGAGVILQDKLISPNFSVTINSSGITMTGGGHTMTLSSSGLVIDGVTFATHEHQAGTYVAGDTAVAGESGAVVADS